MKGKILHYDYASNEGIISSNDGSRYSFKKNDVISVNHIQKGMEVEFLSEGNSAKDIYLTDSTELSNDEGTPFYEEQKYGFKELFCAKGCYTRWQYWKVTLLTFTVWMFFGLYIVMSNTDSNEIADETVVVTGAFFMFVLLPLIYINIVTSIKRFHDTNRSGWFYLLVLIPYLGSLILMIMNGVMPTVKEGNRFCIRKRV